MAKVETPDAGADFGEMPVDDRQYDPRIRVTKGPTRMRNTLHREHVASETFQQPDVIRAGASSRTVSAKCRTLSLRKRKLALQSDKARSRLRRSFFATF